MTSGREEQGVRYNESGKVVQAEQTSTSCQVAGIGELVDLVKKTDVMVSGLMELKFFSGFVDKFVVLSVEMKYCSIIIKFIFPSEV